MTVTPFDPRTPFLDIYPKDRIRLARQTGARTPTGTAETTKTRNPEVRRSDLTVTQAHSRDGKCHAAVGRDVDRVFSDVEKMKNC